MFERDSRRTNETFERDSHLNKSIWPHFQGVLGRREGADSFLQQYLIMSEDERITRRFSLKTLSDANTPKYTEKNKKTHKYTEKNKKTHTGLCKYYRRGKIILLCQWKGAN